MTSLRTNAAGPPPTVLKTSDPAPDLDVSSNTSSSTLTGGNKSDMTRVVFLGSLKVGKTSIIQRFLHNRFDNKYTPTVEDMHTKKYIVGDHLVRLTLVDTAGSFDFPVMLRLCISKANAFVLVFANDDANSLAQAGYLLNQIKLQRKDYAPLNNAAPRYFESNLHNTTARTLASPSPPITVVCNKSDLPPADSQVNEGAIMEWLLANGLKPSQFVYTSAKTNDSITAIFKSLWAQNEVSQAITFDRWEGAQKANYYSNRPRTPPLVSGNDFSALSEAVAPGDGGQINEPTKNENQPTRSRSNFFRSSLRLSRKSSSKAARYQSDLEKLDCVLS
ncbi:unnamed protein product [Calicophoron daubneyi]|uniref:GTP-binding protein Rhes n=1 Tax=Calicophoron daubneyi TaxID=300641 RepID=A0AAV2T8J5_CALDB